MNMFSYIKYFFITAFIGNAIATHAMQQNPALSIVSTYYQQLQNQCALQQYVIYSKDIDSQVEKCRQQIDANKGTITAPVIHKLKGLTATHHPLALYLLGNHEEAFKAGLQQYRFEKGFTELTNMASMCQEDPSLQTSFLCASDAYKWFNDIINAPESKQLTVKGNAAFVLGYMCLHRLGVPTTMANNKTALNYFVRAKHYGIDVNQSVLDSLEQECKQQDAASISTQQIDKPQSSSPEMTKYSPGNNAGKQEQQITLPSNVSQESAQEESYACAVKKPVLTPAIPLQQPIRNKAADSVAHANIAWKKTVLVFPETPIEKQIPMPPAQAKQSTKSTSKKKKHKQTPTISQQTESVVISEMGPIREQITPTITYVDRNKQHQQTPKTTTKQQTKLPKKTKEKSEKHTKQKHDEKIVKAPVTAGNKAGQQQYDEAYTRVVALIKYSMDEDESTPLLTDLLQNSLDQDWRIPQSVYKGAGRLIDNLCKKKKITFPQLTGTLFYLQGNYQEAKKIFFHKKTDMADQYIFTWYLTLLLLTEPQTPERDATILTNLKDVLCHSLKHYKKLTGILWMPDSLASWVRTIANGNETNSYPAKEILARMSILFGCDTIGTSPQEVETLLICVADVENSALICLAEIYCQGLIIEQSASKALAIIQQIIAKPSASEVMPIVLDLLPKIIKLAKQNNDASTQFQATLLQKRMVLQSTYTLVMSKAASNTEDYNNYQAIYHLLEQAEITIEESPECEKHFVTELIMNSGTYEVLIPLTKKHPLLALTLGLITLNRQTVYHYEYPAYAEVINTCVQIADDIEKQIKNGQQPSEEMGMKARKFMEQYNHNHAFCTSTL